MCGRFTQKYTWQELAELYRLNQTPRNIRPAYNVCPTDPVGVLVPGSNGLSYMPMRWGLIPRWWKKSLKELPATFNARVETVSEKPMFRDAFGRNRCLIPASGYYEWQTVGKEKQPYYITPRNGSILSFAGLWEEWERGGEVIESCAIITTEANDLMAEYHDRMPVILHPKDYDLWLDPGVQDPSLLEPLLRPCPSDDLEVYPVSRLVNDPRHEDPKCVEAEPEQT